MTDRFNDVLLIRNAIAQFRDFPSFNAKKALVSLEQVTDWFKDMTIKEEFRSLFLKSPEKRKCFRNILKQIMAMMFP